MHETENEENYVDREKNDNENRDRVHDRGRSKSRTCYDFQEGRCRRGSECRFEHLTDNQEKSEVCYNFQKGNCDRGSDW